MYKFLMVDDEEIVRRGFRRKIDWEALGFEFLEPCENGEQALAAIQAHHPDVVMTDIYMPRVDGLAVAAYAAEHHPEIVVVILSGYDEFEYARQAISSRVFEYVLKPVNSRELTTLLGRLRDRLDADRRTRQEEGVLKEQAGRGADLMKVRSVARLVSGAPVLEGEAEFQHLFGFSPRGMTCAAVVAEPDPAAKMAPPQGKRLSDEVARVAASLRRVLSFSPGEDREALLLFEPDSSSCLRAAQSAAERLAGAGAQQASVGVSGVHSSWTEAARAYQEASAAVSYRLVSRAGKAFRYAPGMTDDPALGADLRSLGESLRRAVMGGDRAETNSRARSLFAVTSSGRLSPQRVRLEVDALFAAILDAFTELGVSPAAVSRDLGMDYDLAVQRLRTVEETGALLARLADYAASVLDSRNLPTPEWKVRDFKEYVARHFGEPNLSVRSLAAGLSISESYLSKLVKRHLDRSVIDYLTEYRLERAKELLATSDLMTYEVAEAAGYADARYFSSTFRRHVGVTPTEYRNARRGKPDRG